MEAETSQDNTAREEIFLKTVLDLILEQSLKNNVLDRKVIEYKSPHDLANIIDFSLPHNGKSFAELIELCKSTFHYSTNICHPRFLNQIYGKPDPYGVAGEAISSALSTNIHTYEVAPVFILAERAILQRCCQLFGYSTGEGAFCPGGSYCNMLALNLAKFTKYPDAKESGIYNLPKQAIFVSKQGHYSVRKNSILLGFGTNGVIDVDCDSDGKMNVEQLENNIVNAKSKGMVPLFLQATAGTTVLGCFDRFDKIADVCEKYGIWMHVDAAYGGSVLFSNKHKHLCHGINRADSVAWNPHKLMSAPIQCSMFLTKHVGMMSKYHSFHVPYLFQQDKPYDTSFDIGTNLIQCGRKIDSFKFWLMWKARGDNGFEKMIDKAFDNIQYFIGQLRKRKNFKMVIENPEFTNAPFWYIPPSLRGCEGSEDYWSKLGEIAPKIKARMQQKGSLMVGYQPLGDKVNFFRLAVVNKDVSFEDMDFVLDEIELLGTDL